MIQEMINIRINDTFLVSLHNDTFKLHHNELHDAIKTASFYGQCKNLPALIDFANYMIDTVDGHKQVLLTMQKQADLANYIF